MKFNLSCNTSKESPESVLFSAIQCDALFAAVLVHDELYPEAKLPDAIHLDYSQEQLAQCYRICRQLWKDSVDRKSLCQMIENICTQGSLNADAQYAYYCMRAKIKHMRFAYITFDERHRYPRVFQWMTGIMGNLQDALKNQQRFNTLCWGGLVRLLLSKPFYAMATREINHVQQSTVESFRQYVHSEINFIRGYLAKSAVTGKEFHEIRKVISRQVAMYDNLKTLYPSPYHRSISECLSTINGLMGSMHDMLITKKLNKTQDYYADTFPIPEDIKQRLIDLTNKYQTATNPGLFQAEQCDALFAALLVDDLIKLDVEPPNHIHFDYTQEQLTQCYQISHQLWKEGVSRNKLCQMIEKIHQQDALNTDDQYTYYCMRAKIKHLRFAYVTYDERHRYPKLFQWMTGIMGNLQDAIKHKQRFSITCSAIITRLFLSKLCYTMVVREMNQFQPSSVESFRHFIQSDINFICLHLAKNEITSKEFHEMRKVISRQVAFYDCIDILYPSDYHHTILLYLSTINGLMGSKHDDLIAAKFNKTQDYHNDTFAISDEIKQRLIIYTNKYN